MIPGEYRFKDEAPELIGNQGLETKTLCISNKGDRPIQIGSHFHFFEVNECLEFKYNNIEIRKNSNKCIFFNK